MSIVQSGLLFAGEIFVASAIVLALAWEAAQMFAARAALRHLVWLCALATLIVLPLLALAVPSQIHVLLPAPPVAHVVLVPDASPAASAMIDKKVLAMPPSAPEAVASWHFNLQAIGLAVFAVWLAGVIALALRGGAALIGLRALKRQSRLHKPANGEILIGQRYEIRMSREPNGYGPITWGLIRPVILLPFSAQFWMPERLQAVLLHETAHIARRDSFSQLLATIACTLYWPNPLVWMASHALRNEAEIAADDMVIASGMRPSSYAGELLQLASEFRSRQPALAGMPLFMAAPSALEARVKSVLAANPSRSGVTFMDVLKTGTIAVLAAAALMFARPSFAQDVPPPPPAPPAVDTAPLPPPPPAQADAADMPAPPAVAQMADVPAPPVPPVRARLANAPPPPPAPPAPAALAAPEALPAPPAPPAPAPVVELDGHHSIEVRDTDEHGHHVHRIWVDGRELNAEEMERIRPKLEAAQAQVRAMEPAMRRAQVEIRIQQDKIREMQARMPAIEAQVREELARAQPEIDRAIAQARAANMDVRVQQSIDKATKAMKVRIEIQKAHDAHMDEHDDVPPAPDEN